ncbi:MAG TPA: hypothetical protein VLY03_09170 [Bacteroidota bacterium]|nr:hypothetical protein [Bacteroidota bacterium]
MFCPKCRYEYRKGFTICTDCNIPLVEELAEANEESEVLTDTRFVEVLSTYDQSDIAQVKGILDAEKISYYVQAEMSSYLFPFAQPSIVMVERCDVGKAIMLIRPLKLRFLRMIFSGDH